MMERGETRLLIDIGEIRDHDAALAQNILDNPAAWLPSFDKTLSEKVADLNPDYGRENKVRRCYVFSSVHSLIVSSGKILHRVRRQLRDSPRHTQKPERHACEQTCLHRRHRDQMLACPVRNPRIPRSAALMLNLTVLNAAGPRC